MYSSFLLQLKSTKLYRTTVVSRLIASSESSWSFILPLTEYNTAAGLSPKVRVTCKLREILRIC